MLDTGFPITMKVKFLRMLRTKHLIRICILIVLVFMFQEVWRLFSVTKTTTTTTTTRTIAVVNIKMFTEHSNYSANVTVTNITDVCDPHEFSWETKGALTYAKTEDCRNQIKDFACRHAQNKIFPAELPRFCPTEAVIPYGCYEDSGENRVLIESNTRFPFTNDIGYCIRHCFKLGHLFAGVEYGIECQCGNDIQTGRRKTDESDCEAYVCPGNKSEFCGGNWRISVFSTGIPDYKVNLTMPNPLKGKTHLRPVRIVFLLTVSGRRNLRQIVRLINNIYSPNHYYYIHVDKRDEYLYRELIKLESHTTNIRVKRNRFIAIWAGPSMLQVMFDSFKDLFELFKDWKWDYLINLSESDLPLFPISKFENFLSANRQWNFAGKYAASGLDMIAQKGIEVEFYECENKMWRLGIRQFPKNIQVAGDVDWFVLKRDFLYYITYSTDALVEGLKLYYRYSSIPLESFFHSVLANSKFCHTHAGQNLKLISWELHGQACTCKFHWCICSPRAFTKQQIKQINYKEELKNLHFFVRKFDATVDQTAIDLVESKVHPYSTNCSEKVSKPNSKNYWFNDYHYLDAINETDPAKLTLLQGLLYMALNQSVFKWDYIQSAQVLELNVLLSDKQEFMILKYQLQTPKHNNSQSVFETVFKYQPIEEIVSETSLFKNCEIGSNWDVKASIFRNYARSFGTTTSLGISIDLFFTQTTDLGFNWIDPDNNIANSLKYTHKAEKPKRWIKDHIRESKTPIIKKPGIWTLKIVLDESVVQRVKFAILPDCNCSSPVQLYNLEEPPTATDTISAFYRIVDNCAISSERSSISDVSQHCLFTNWSSVALDPKSVFACTLH